MKRHFENNIFCDNYDKGKILIKFVIYYFLVSRKLFDSTGYSKPFNNLKEQTLHDEQKRTFWQTFLVT